MLAFEGYRTWQGSFSKDNKDRDQQLLELLKSAEDLYHMEKSIIRKGSSADSCEVKAGYLFLASTQLMAQVATKRGDYPQAYHCYAY